MIERAVSLKAGKAELISVYIDVEPISFNRGFYTVDVRYFYYVTAEAFVCAARPVEVAGLCVFDKRVILFGSEGSAKVFTSSSCVSGAEDQVVMCDNLPVAVVETIALNSTNGRIKKQLIKLTQYPAPPKSLRYQMQHVVA